MDLSKELREARKRTSLKLTDVADRLGTSHATVSRWETGTTGLPDLPTLERWAAIVGLRLDVRLVADRPDYAEELRSILTNEELRLLVSTVRIVKNLS